MNIKKILFSFFGLLIGLIILCPLQSEENQLPISKSELQKPQYTLSICAIFKDEAPYFKEWIEFHRLVGAEHFYLYNNGSTDNFHEVLDPYVQNGIVTIIEWPNLQQKETETSQYNWVHSTQIPAYEHACRISTAGKTKWLALIDVDEFIVPTQQKNIVAILEKYESHPGIMALWHTFGTSGVVTIPANKLLIECMHKTCAPDHDFSYKLVKTILKPELYDHFIWPPHACVFKGNTYAYQLYKDEIQINHYINRTVDYYYNQKVKKKEAMDNVKLSQHLISSWAEIGNDIENQNPSIDRFVPELRRRLGYDQ